MKFGVLILQNTSRRNRASKLRRYTRETRGNLARVDRFSDRRRSFDFLIHRGTNEFRRYS